MNLAAVTNSNSAFLTATQNDATEAADKVKKAKDLAKVEVAAGEFEAVFIAEMLKPMFEGITTDGMFGGGKGEEVFRGQLLQEYGKMISQTGSLGVSSWVKEAMIKMQEEAQGGPAPALKEITEEQVTEETTALLSNNEVTQ